jgi:glutamyl-tRNA reductase
MITTITIILLTISCILQKKVMNLHNETNTRISEYHIDTTRRFDTDVNELHYLVREIEIEIKSDTKKKLEKLTEQIIKKIPTTNEELLKEVQQMRDDFFALRQNF